MAANELTWKVTVDPALAARAMRELAQEAKRSTASITADVRKEAQSAVALQRQRSGALVAQWKSDNSAAISLQRQRSAALVAAWKAEQREQVRIAREAQRQVEQAALESQRRRSAFFAGAAGGVTALIGVSAISEIRNAASAWVDYSSKLETTKIAFTTMLGSAQLAEQHLKELQQFALTTPFQFSDLIDASQRMQALGFNAQQVLPILSSVGDAVSAAGGGSERLDRVVLALSQIQSKGKVMTQEMNQLAESGIPAWKMLEEQLGKSRGELVKMVEQGQISSAVFLEAFQKFSQQNFGGLMEAQSKTFTGAMSNIKDALLQTSATAFAPLYERISEIAKELAKTSTTSKEFQQNMEAAGKGIIQVWDGAVEIFHVVRDAIGLVGAVAIQVFGGITHVILATVEAARGFYFGLQAIARFMVGDFRGALELANRSTQATENAANEVTQALKAQGAVAEQVVRIYENAEARKAAAAISAAAKIAQVSVGSPPELKLEDMVGAGILRKRQLSIGSSGGGGGGSAAKISEGQRLLNQLTEEHNRLTAKANELSKVQIVALEILDSKYKGLSTSLRGQILEQAAQIDATQKSIDADKRKEQATEKIRALLESQTKAVYDATHADKDWNAEVTALEAELKKLNLTMDEGTKKMLLDNAARLKAISLAQQLVDIEKQTADELENEREALRELEQGQRTHLDTATIFIAKKIAEAEAVGGVTEKMREYFALLIKIAAKQDEIAAEEAGPKGKFRRAAKDAAKKAGEAGGWQGQEVEPPRDAFGEFDKQVRDTLSGATLEAALFGIDAMRSSFEMLGSAVGEAVRSFVLFGKVEGGFRKFAAEMIASIAQMAAVQAVYQAAQGLAWLALNYFFPNPAYYKAAMTAFASAAVFGAIAGVAAVAGRAVAGNKFVESGGSGSSTASSAFRSASGTGTQTEKPTTSDVNRRALAQPTAQPVINVTVQLHGDIATDALTTRVRNAVVSELDLNDGRLTTMIQDAAKRGR